MIGHYQMLCQTWSQEDEPSIYMQNVFNLLKYLKALYRSLLIPYNSTRFPYLWLFERENKYQIIRLNVCKKFKRMYGCILPLNTGHKTNKSQTNQLKFTNTIKARIRSLKCSIKKPA